MEASSSPKPKCEASAAKPKPAAIPASGPIHERLPAAAAVPASPASAVAAAIAAESLGLGTVYIGAIRNNLEGVAKELGLPPRAFATFGMCIGHPDPAQLSAIKPRLPQASVLHKEQYNVGVHEQVVPGYNDTMDAFYEAQKMKPLGAWDLHSLNRVRGPEAMAGRDGMVAALNKLGFALK